MDVRQQLSRAVYTAEHALLHLRSSSEPVTRTGDSDVDLSEALLLAAHLYLHLAVRELPGTARMHLNMLGKLHAAVPESLANVVLLWDDLSLEVLLWVLFVGAAAARAHASRPVFVRRLREVSVAVGVASRADLEAALKGVLWLDRFCERHCEGIWAEMGLQA
jgi:hypothetical protein